MYPARHGRKLVAPDRSGRTRRRLPTPTRRTTSTTGCGGGCSGRCRSGLYVVGQHRRRRAAQRDDRSTGPRRCRSTRSWSASASSDGAFTHELIDGGRVFALCVIDREDRAIVRKFTKPVEVDLDGEDAQRVPVRRRRSPARRSSTRRSAYLDCEVRQAVDVREPHVLHRRGGRRRLPASDEETEVLRMEDTRMNYGG